jgi:hypothetical protein
LNSEERRAMPIMTYPGLDIEGKNVLDLVRDGDVQYKCIKTLSDRYPEVIRMRTLELLNGTSSYKNFVLSIGCDVPPGTDLENIDAMFKALNEYNDEKLKAVEIDFTRYFENELLEKEILLWDDSFSVA